MKIHTIILLLTCSVICCGFTISVPEDHALIQDAIDAAVEGDTVLVAPGEYRGDGNHNLNPSGRAIKILASAGPDSTIIDCENMGWGFIFQDEGGPGTHAVGFTIRNGNTHYGGGIVCNGASTTIIDCVMESCTGNLGGGFYCKDAAPLLEGCTVTGCLANNGGGAFILDSQPTLYGCTFEGNESESSGGGIVAVGTDMIVLSCVFTGNKARSGGGGICCWNNEPVILASVFDSNFAGLSGGGIDFKYASPTVSNTILSGNSAGLNGGAAALWESAGLWTNCLIVENSAEFGAGLDIMASSPVLKHCTTSANGASTGGSIYSGMFSDVVVANAILWGSSPDEIFLESGDVLVTSSNIEGGWAGAGNLSADPLFSDPENGNYRIVAGSPCADAGEDVSVSIDLDGDLRPLGAGFDIGADELIPVGAIQVEASGFDDSLSTGDTLHFLVEITNPDTVTHYFDRANYLVEGPASTERPMYSGSLFSLESGGHYEAAYQIGPILDSTPAGCYTVTVRFFYRGTVIADTAFQVEVIHARSANNGSSA